MDIILILRKIYGRKFEYYKVRQMYLSPYCLRFSTYDDRDFELLFDELKYFRVEINK